MGHPAALQDGELCGGYTSPVSPRQLAHCRVSAGSKVGSKHAMLNLDMSSYLVILCNPRPAEGQDGNFRFVLTGSDLLEVRFQPAEVLPYDAEAFTNMELHGQFQLGALPCSLAMVQTHPL
jgi:hypothetical protein